MEDLLDVSRIRTGKFSYSFEQDVNFSELVRAMMDRFTIQFQRAGTPIELDLEEGIVGVLDPARIEQIIDNLVSNVLKYAPGSPIKVSLRQERQEAIFTVSDMGPGIPVDKQEKIFERFERATDTTGVSGLGLGLFIVREIARAHGGDAALESAPGAGSKFCVRLPLRGASSNSVAAR